MKKFFSLHIVLLISIVCIGVFLRFYMLGSIPSSLNWDEVSWGYNGYSVLHTGKDEHGVFLPLSFKAFGDFKQPVYVYLETLSVFLFGLTPFAVRFPSALLGSLSIISVYFLIRTLFKDLKSVKVLALVTAALFAISPWSIQFSRVAYEANVAVFFVVTGIGLTVFGIQTKRLAISVLGAIILAISGYTYHSAKIFSPLLLVGLLIYSKWGYKVTYKFIFIVFVAFLVASSAWIIDSRTTARGRSVLFTSNQTEILKEPSALASYDIEHNHSFDALSHNRRIVYADLYARNYLSHYEPSFLFIGNDNPRHHPPFMGMLYVVFLPFIIAGMVYIVKNRIKPGVFIYYWFIIAPLAASLAFPAPNASRSLAFLPTWDIFAAFGIVALLSVKNQLLKRMLIGIFIFAFCINFFYYVHNYFSYTNFETSFDWQKGYKEAVEFAYKQNNFGKKVFFDKTVEQPYIFYLFYSAYLPEKYIENGGSENSAKSCFRIDNVFFGACGETVNVGDYSVVVGKDSKVEGTKKIKEIKTENGITALSIFEKIE